MHRPNKASRNFFLAFRRWTIANDIPAHHHHSTSTASHRYTTAALKTGKSIPRRQPRFKSRHVEEKSTARRQSQIKSQHIKGKPDAKHDIVKHWLRIHVPLATDRKLFLHLLGKAKLARLSEFRVIGQDVLLSSRSARNVQEAFRLHLRAFQLCTGIPYGELNLRIKRVDEDENDGIRLRDGNPARDFEHAQRSSVERQQVQKSQFVWVRPYLAGRLLRSSSPRVPGPYDTTSRRLRSGVKIDFPVKRKQNFMCVRATDISSLIEDLDLRYSNQIDTPEQYRSVRFVDQHVARRSKPYRLEDYKQMAWEFEKSHDRRFQRARFDEESSTIDNVTVDIINSGLRNRDLKLVENLDRLMAMGIFDADSFAIVTHNSMDFDRSRLRGLTFGQGKDATVEPVGIQADPPSQSLEDGVEITANNAVGDSSPAIQAGLVSQTSQDLEPTASIAIDDRSADITAAEPTLQDDLRAMLSPMTNSVVLITTCDTEGSGSERFRGITVSSFATVSMKPEPFISFNVRIPSRTYTAFQRSGEVCVHILAGNKPAATIADTFTKSYEHASAPFKLLSDAGANVIAADGCPPRIDYQDSVIAWLRCGDFNTNASYTVGDHRICVFAVKQVIRARNLPQAQTGLAYSDKRYQKVKPSSAILPLVLLSQNSDSVTRPNATVEVSRIDQHRESKQEKPEQKLSPEKSAEATARGDIVTDFASADATTNEIEREQESTQTNASQNEVTPTRSDTTIDRIEQEQKEAQTSISQDKVTRTKSDSEEQKKHEKRTFPPLAEINRRRIDSVKLTSDLTDAAKIFLSNLERDLSIDLNDSTAENDGIEHDEVRLEEEHLAMRNVERERRSLMEDAANAVVDDSENDALPSADQYMESEAIMSENMPSNRLAARRADQDRRFLLDQAANALLDDPTHDISPSSLFQYIPPEAAVVAERKPAERFAERNTDKERRSLLDQAADVLLDDQMLDAYPSNLSQYVQSRAAESMPEDRFAKRQADEKRRSSWNQAASDGLDDPAHEISSFYSLQDVPSEAAVEAESMSTERLDDQRADEEQRSLLDQTASIDLDNSAHEPSLSNPSAGVSSTAAADSESEGTDLSTKQEADQEQQDWSNQEATPAFVDSSSITSFSDPSQDFSSAAAVESESEETGQSFKPETDQEPQDLLDREANPAFIDSPSTTSSSNAPQDVLSAAAVDTESDETDQSTKQEADQEQPDLDQDPALIDTASNDFSLTPVQDSRGSAAAATHGRMPTTLALIPKVTADKSRANSLQPTQQASPLHTVSSAWRPNYTRQYSSSSAILLKEFADGRTSSNNDKSHQEDATTGSRTSSQYNSSTSSSVAKTDYEDTADIPTPDLSITVNDFLCHSFVRHGKRNNRLYNARTVTRKAEERLKEEMADGTLTPELSEKLESLIASNERFIAWTLAERAAFDLAEMLDQGQIVHSRISFIEGCIERGQQAIYEEAQVIMNALEKKSVTIDWYEKRQQVLVKTEAILRDELVRLRAFHEDDDRDDW